MKIQRICLNCPIAVAQAENRFGKGDVSLHILLRKFAVAATVLARSFWGCFRCTTPPGKAKRRKQWIGALGIMSPAEGGLRKEKKMHFYKKNRLIKQFFYITLLLDELR